MKAETLPSKLRDARGKMIDADFTIVRLLPDAKAVLSAKGLCQVVVQPADEILFEFVTRDFAHQ